MSVSERIRLQVPARIQDLEALISISKCGVLLYTKHPIFSIFVIITP